MLAQVSHANGAVILSCSGGRESFSKMMLISVSLLTWYLRHSAGAYRMFSSGEASKAKKRTKSSEWCALGQTTSVGGCGHYAAPLGER